MEYYLWISILINIIFFILFLFSRKKEKRELTIYNNEKDKILNDIELKRRELELLDEQRKKEEGLIQEALRRELQASSEFIANQYESGIKELNLKLQLEEKEIDNIKKGLSEKLHRFEEDNQRIVDMRKQEFQGAIATLDEELNDYRKKYRATIQAAIENEEKEFLNRLVIPKNDVEDIMILEEKVLPLLHSPEPIRKLVWTLYVQKPSNDLLNRILPSSDCSGIYKITSLKNKKCYIGRSVNVKNRLQEHIKSAIGIGTIADQKIHEIMREEGIWNFTYELIEEVEKDKLAAREKHYISFFESDKNAGYNMKAGG